VLYDAGEWGVGELLLDGDLVLWHELPQRGPQPQGAHPLAGRLAAYFSGARDSFADVAIDLDWCTPFQRSAAEALRAVPYGEP
jgi:O6-methylguanine-DNA--protein-cysteine methyltransferase